VARAWVCVVRGCSGVFSFVTSPPPVPWVPVFGGKGWSSIRSHSPAVKSGLSVLCGILVFGFFCAWPPRPHSRTSPFNYRESGACVYPFGVAFGGGGFISGVVGYVAYWMGRGSRPRDGIPCSVLGRHGWHNMVWLR